MSIKDNVNDLQNIVSSLESKVTSVYESGKQSEYNRFWDAYQQNGNNTNYTFMFAGPGWNHDTFRPKYPVRPVGSAAYMFRYCSLVDLKSHCEQHGIVIDTSAATNVDTIFQQSTIETFGDLDTRGCSKLIGALYYAKTLRTIRIILRDDGSQGLERNFNEATDLENLEIVGKFGASVDLHWSTKLTHDSLMSVINALKNMFVDNIVTDEIVDTNIFFGEPDIFSFEDTFASTGERVYFVGGDIDEWQNYRTYYCVLRDGIYYVVDMHTWGLSDDDMLTGYTLTIGTTNLAKLTNEDIAIATEKGWTLL